MWTQTRSNVTLCHLSCWKALWDIYRTLLTEVDVHEAHLCFLLAVIKAEWLTWASVADSDHKMAAETGRCSSTSRLPFSLCCFLLPFYVLLTLSSSRFSSFPIFFILSIFFFSVNMLSFFVFLTSLLSSPLSCLHFLRFHPFPSLPSCLHLLPSRCPFHPPPSVSSLSFPLHIYSFLPLLVAFSGPSLPPSLPHLAPGSRSRWSD